MMNKHGRGRGAGRGRGSRSKNRGRGRGRGNDRTLRRNPNNFKGAAKEGHPLYGAVLCSYDDGIDLNKLDKAVREVYIPHNKAPKLRVPWQNKKSPHRKGCSQSKTSMANIYRQNQRTTECRKETSQDRTQIGQGPREEKMATDKSNHQKLIYGPLRTI